MKDYEKLVCEFGEKFGELLELGNEIAKYGITINYSVSTTSSTAIEDSRNLINKALDEQFSKRNMNHKTTYSTK